jgi:hypothetical protein
MSNKRRRSSKKKHEVSLTEDMLNELNKASMGHHGAYNMAHHGSSSGANQMGYDNYGQDPDEYDMEDIWNNDTNYGGHPQKPTTKVLLPSLSLVSTFSTFSTCSTTKTKQNATVSVGSVLK